MMAIDTTASTRPAAAAWRCRRVLGLACAGRVPPKTAAPARRGRWRRSADREALRRPRPTLSTPASIQQRPFLPTSTRSALRPVSSSLRRCGPKTKAPGVGLRYGSDPQTCPVRTLCAWLDAARHHVVPSRSSSPVSVTTTCAASRREKITRTSWPPSSSVGTPSGPLNAFMPFPGSVRRRGRVSAYHKSALTDPVNGAPLDEGRDGRASCRWRRCARVRWCPRVRNVPGPDHRVG
jgi:hypothetical protein